MSDFRPRGYIQTPHVANVAQLTEASLASLRNTLDVVFAEVLRWDRLARSGKFGGTHILLAGPDHARLAVLVEEVGKVARELNETLIGNNARSLRSPPPDRTLLIKELIQVAACAAAWAASLGREEEEI